jgi:hypothetical protein
MNLHDFRSSHYQLYTWGLIAVGSMSDIISKKRNRFVDRSVSVILLIRTGPGLPDSGLNSLNRSRISK